MRGMNAGEMTINGGNDDDLILCCGFSVFVLLLVTLLLVLNRLQVPDQVRADALGHPTDIVEQVMQQAQFLCKKEIAKGGIL